jgi:hypothetical protein
LFADVLKAHGQSGFIQHSYDVTKVLFGALKP